LEKGDGGGYGGAYDLQNLPSPLSFDKLRMVSFVEPFAKEGEKKNRNDPLDYAKSPFSN
jgi:hypothetical protein